MPGLFRWALPAAVFTPASASLTVNTGVLNKIVVSPATQTVAAGVSQAYSAEGFDQYGNSLGAASVTWSIDSGAEGTWTANSVIATKVGTWTVTATDTANSAIFGPASLTVVAGSLASITVTGSSSVVAGNAASFTAAGADEYGNPVTIAPTWSVSSGSISAGSVTEKADGSYTVTATVGSVNGGATFSVTSAALSTITVSGPSTVVAGNAASFTAAGADEYGNPVTIAPTWSVSSGSISAGSVTEKADGSYTVTATVGSVNGGATFSVTSAALSTITVSGPSTVVAGNAASFTAAGADEMGTR